MMKYVTPLNVFLYFCALGVLGVGFIEYVFWAKHMYYEDGALVIFALFPSVGGIAAALTAYIQRKSK